MSSLAEGTSLGEEVAALGSRFDGVRGLNRKTGGRKRLGAEKLRKVSEADRILKEASKVLCPPLQEILFYPFFFQVHSFFREGVEKEAAPALLKAAASMPFMLLKAAGEKGAEIQKTLLGASSTLPDLDRSYLAKISGASLEEKAGLLGRMRSNLQKRAGEEGYDEFRKLYQGLLTDLAERRESLSERERRELAHVMNSSVLRDLPLLWTDPGDLGQLLDILKPMAAIGLENGKMAVLGLILAEKVRDPEMKKQAQDSLKNQAGPAEEDIFWVLDSFPELITPEVGCLSSVLEVSGTEAGFIPPLVERLRQEIEIFLIAHAASRRLRGLLGFLNELSSEDMKMVWPVWRREVAALKGYPPFFPLQEFIGCFLEGYFTEKGFRRYLDLRWEKEGGLDWFFLELEKNRKQSLLAKRFLSDPLFPFPIQGTMLEMEKTLFHFLEERFEGMKTASLDTLEKLTGILMERKPTVTEGNLLVRISNLLGERASEEENRTHALREKILKCLIHFKPGAGRRRPR